MLPVIEQMALNAAFSAPGLAILKVCSLDIGPLRTYTYAHEHH
jgi:hypothetical protein